MDVRKAKLDFWKAKGKNCLLQGRPGIGKTALVIECMKRANLSFENDVAQWSTPLLDFSGGNVEKADFLFFDQVGDEKSLQAAKEIISLRRWKGRAIKPTAVIWACHTSLWDGKGEQITDLPTEFLDIFDVQICVSFRPSDQYFIDKFGKNIAKSALQWWDKLSFEEQLRVSPRRLDQALDMWKSKGDIRDSLPCSCNVLELTIALVTTSDEEKLNNLVAQDETTKTLFFSNEKNFGMMYNLVCESDVFLHAFLPYFSQEKLVMTLYDNKYGDRVFPYTIALVHRVPLFRDAFVKILKENKEKNICKKIRKALTDQYLHQLLKVSETTGQ